MTSSVRAARVGQVEVELDELFVLRTRPLRRGVALASTARFRNDSWPLGPAVLQNHSPSWVLNFDSIPANHRQVAKELCHAMLSGDLPLGESRRQISSIRSMFSEFKRFLTWLDARHRATGRPATLTAVTATDLGEYAQHLLTAVPAAERRRFSFSSTRYFWRYRQVLSTDRLLVDPQGVPGWTEPHHRRQENRTDRIPEQVLGPLVGWSMRFVTDFAGDILAADRAWNDRRSNTAAGKKMTTARAEAALQDLLTDHIATNRPLPGRGGVLNEFFLATTIGSSRPFIHRQRQQIDAVAATIGIGELSFYRTLDGLLDGRPWIEGIATDYDHRQGLATLARMLQAACYVVIAFLSGMRDGEVKHLRRGCLRVIRDADGHPYRWTLTSLAFKGERDPSGVQATWTVGKPVATAIEVLQHLQPPDVDELFAGLRHSPGQGPVSRSANSVLTAKTTNRQLNALAAWINIYCQSGDRVDRIPLVDGRPFRVTTRQFRRTLAWFIARQPGGAIAGAIHYRHLSIQMFEGYAGTSDSGFRAEVESEQALARGEHYLAAIDTHDHYDLLGPAAQEGRRRLELFGASASFAGSVVTDRRRLLRIVQRHDPAIYPGTYATCVFDPDKALCRPRPNTATPPRPALQDCQPLDCKNVALDAQNIAALRAEISDIDLNLADRPLLNPLLLHRLRERREQIQTFIHRCTTEEQ